MVSVSVCQGGHPDSCPARSTCLRKVEFYQGAIDMSPPVLTTGSTKAVHVLSCLCDNACKQSLAICRKSRALLAGFCLSLYGLHVLNRDVNMIQSINLMGEYHYHVVVLHSIILCSLHYVRESQDRNISQCF